LISGSNSRSATRLTETGHDRSAKPISGSGHEAVDDFLANITATRSAGTARYYSSRLATLLDYLRTRDLDILDIRPRHLDAYLAGRVPKVSRNTLRHDAIAARSFTRWARAAGLIETDALANYVLPAGELPTMRAPSADTVASLLAQAGRPDRTARSAAERRRHQTITARDRAMVGTLAETGLRISEMAALDVQDVDLQRRVLTVRPGKTHKARVVPISTELGALIGTWLRVRPDVPDPALYLSIFGERVLTDTLREWLSRLCVAAGVEHVRPHDLRRYALSELVHKASVLVAREVAGHASIATTNRYASINPELVRQGVDQAGVLAGLVESNVSPKRRRVI
jgi:integrase/recombinase XerC